MTRKMCASLACAMTITGLLLAAPAAMGIEPRTKEQCVTLFHNLNTSGNGHLTIPEAAKNADMLTVLSAPSLWKRGYITQNEFTPLCAGKRNSAQRD